MSASNSPDTRKRQERVPPQVSEGHGPSNTLILAGYPLELGNKLLLFLRQPLYEKYFVTAALGGAQKVVKSISSTLLLAPPEPYE